MKFTCATNELKDALAVVSRAVAVKSQTPILAGVYIRAEGSTLELQANNFSVGIITKIPVNTEEPGELVVISKYLQEIVGKLPGETVTISRNEGEVDVKIQSGSANYELLSMTAEDFPKVKAQETVVSFKIKSSTLKNLIRKTVFSCSSGEARPIFTGVLFEINGDSVTAAATNTHRVSIMTGNICDEIAELSFIVPAATLRDLMRMLDTTAADNLTTIDYSGKSISFIFDNILVNSRLIEGQFPPYKKVIPKTSDTFATVRISEMLSAVDRVAVISKETEYNTIRFIFSQDGLEISSNSFDVGKSQEHVDAVVEGPDLDISFNVLYIVEVLKALDGEVCRIAMTKPLAPIDVREQGTDNFIYIVTPVRTSN